MVRTGEGVFTPEQMRALSPVTSNVNNIVTNVYVDSSGRVSTTTQGTSGLTQSDYREMGNYSQAKYPFLTWQAGVVEPDEVSDGNGGMIEVERFRLYYCASTKEQLIAKLDGVEA